MEATKFPGGSAGLRVVIYPGDNKILIAMSIDANGINDSDKNLAGFAIWRKYDGKPEQILSNRIGFDSGVNNETTAETREWTDSDQAPFQKFRWVDVPPDGFDVPITYRVQARYFTGQGFATKAGPEVSIKAEPVKQLFTKFRAAFTRGYIASQAYADKFQNKDIRPAGPKKPDFDTRPFEAQYAWLGADARVQLFDFIADCEKDTSAKIDVFAYDLDEPDVIAAICRMGKQGRLRAVLDNASLHSTAGKDGTMPVEIDAAKMIIAAAGKGNVRQGHFSRFQHNKVFIKRDANGNAQRVIFGSMNFSVRGLYVQANNVVVVDDPGVAGMFAKAFDNAFANNVATAPFQADPIAGGYMVCSATASAALPKFSLALSPHRDFGRFDRPDGGPDPQGDEFGVFRGHGADRGRGGAHLVADNRRAADGVFIRHGGDRQGPRGAKPRRRDGRHDRFCHAHQERAGAVQTGVQRRRRHAHPRQVRRGRLQRRQSDGFYRLVKSRIGRRAGERRQSCDDRGRRRGQHVRDRGGRAVRPLSLPQGHAAR